MMATLKPTAALMMVVVQDGEHFRPTNNHRICYRESTFHVKKYDMLMIFQNV